MKKLTALLMAMLLVILPVLGSAATTGEIIDAAKEAGLATKTTVTFVPADLTAMLGTENAAIYTDLLNALGLVAYENNDANNQVGVKVTLQGKEVANFDFVRENGTAYVNTNFLGESLAVDQDEWQPLMEKLVDLMVSSDAMSAAEGKMLKEQIAAYFSGEAAAVMPTASNAFEHVDWTPVTNKAMEILNAKGKISAVTEQPGTCDQAANMLTLTLNGDDIVAIYEAVANALSTDVSAMNYLNSELAESGMTAEELLIGLLDGIKETMAAVEGDIPMVIYMSAAGNIVCMTFDMTMVQGAERVAVDFDYNRATIDSGVNHTVTLDAMIDGAKIMDCGFTYLDAGEASLVAGEMIIEAEGEKLTLNADAVFDEKNLDASFKLNMTGSETVSMDMNILSKETDTTTNVDVTMNVLADGEEVGLSVKVADEQIPGDTSATGKGTLQLGMSSGGVEVGAVAAYEAKAEKNADGAKRDIVCDVKLSVMGMELPLLTINANTVTGQPEASIASAEAIHLADYSDEQMAAYGQQVEGTAMVALLGIMQNLPQSILMMVMGQ